MGWCSKREEWTERKGREGAEKERMGASRQREGEKEVEVEKKGEEEGGMNWLVGCGEERTMSL